MQKSNNEVDQSVTVISPSKNMSVLVLKDGVSVFKYENGGFIRTSETVGRHTDYSLRSIVKTSDNKVYYRISDDRYLIDNHDYEIGISEIY